MIFGILEDNHERFSRYAKILLHDIQGVAKALKTLVLTAHWESLKREDGDSRISLDKIQKTTQLITAISVNFFHKKAYVHIREVSLKKCLKLFSSAIVVIVV